MHSVCGLLLLPTINDIIIFLQNYLLKQLQTGRKAAMIQDESDGQKDQGMLYPCHLALYIHCTMVVTF